jgi:hypothetical protein
LIVLFGGGLQLRLYLPRFSFYRRASTLGSVECLSKNEIKNEPPLGGVSFSFVHRCSAYIRHICSVVLLLPVSVHLVQRPIFNNIFAVKKNFK